MCNIAGVGCDTVRVSRIERLLSNPRFSEKVYTSRERASLTGRSPQTAAGSWAAKEAVCKALGTGFTGFSPRDIEILRDKNGQPYVLLQNGAERIAAARCITRIHISISHEQNQALAFAIAETRLQTAP